MKRVTFYMKSGNVIKLKFNKFTTTKLSSNKDERELNWSGCNKEFTVDIDEIEAIIIH